MQVEIAVKDVAVVIPESAYHTGSGFTPNFWSNSSRIPNPIGSEPEATAFLYSSQGVVRRAFDLFTDHVIASAHCLTNIDSRRPWAAVSRSRNGLLHLVAGVVEEQVNAFSLKPIAYANPGSPFRRPNEDRRSTPILSNAPVILQPERLGDAYREETYMLMVNMLLLAAEGIHNQNIYKYSI